MRMRYFQEPNTKSEINDWDLVLGLWFLEFGF
jgi:hypothetical protein